MKPQDRFTNARHAKAFRKLDQAVALERNGSLAEADSAYADVIRSNPQYFDALHLYGLLKFKKGQLSDAIRLIEKAHMLNPGSLNALNSLGVVYAHLKNYGQALDTFNKIIERDENNVQALSNKAQCLNELGRFQETVDICNKILSLDKFKFHAYLARGAALLELGNYEEALSNYQKVVEFNQRYEMGWCGIGNALCRLKRRDEALVAYDRALSIKPDLEGAWLGRGNVFSDLKRYGDALAAYDKALSIKPDLAVAHSGRAKAHNDLKQYDNALAAYDRALRLDPDLKYAEGHRLQAKMHLCDWTNIEAEIARLLLNLRNQKPLMPFVSLSIPSSPMEQLQCAKNFIAEQGSIVAPLWHGQIYPHNRIRIAYLSADFREHATAYLITDLFEHHDKARFEVIAISFGPVQNSHMHQRIAGAVEHFVDISQQSDQKIADLIRQLEVDIAVDLNGFAGDARLGVLARRPAPIQVNYLGFPGTLGASYIDYIIADRHVIPESQKAFYEEKVVYLPECYQANDRKKEIASHTRTRAECDLPEEGFVFCCFNNSYKILPEVFDRWMRILSQIDGSVLWLFGENQETMANLRKAAAARNVSPERLVFAKRLPLADHLARHRLADLFLDTLPYNAHTTGSDALWAGVPVLTCRGDTFAGRVGVSLLHAVRLPELITTSLDAYEATAVGLARDPEKLGNIKRKLAEHRLRTPLFDTELFTKHMERAYSAMYDRYRAALGPDHIDIRG